MRAQMIENYLQQLSASLGRRPPIDEEELHKLFFVKDYPGMVAWIRKQLRIQCRIRVGIVRSGGLSAPAWVTLSENMPMYGTSDFNRLMVSVYIRKDFVDTACFEQVVVAIAHELSHIILDSVRHPLRREEEAVDLTAMLLGYRDFFITGAEDIVENSSTGLIASLVRSLFGISSVQTIRQVGYLSPTEIRHAARCMTVRP